MNKWVLTVVIATAVYASGATISASSFTTLVDLPFVTSGFANPSSIFIIQNPYADAYTEREDFV